MSLLSDGRAIKFSCQVPTADPATPGFVSRTQAATLKAQGVIRDLKTFTRYFFDDGRITMPDGTSIEHWGFAAREDSTPYPSPVIRATERDLIQVHMDAGDIHTMHHHGIEPDAFNDGVGHTSFESEDYTYQMQPHHAGTYLYHCHVNTTLHFQMGLFGPIVIDPPPDPGDPPGTKRVFSGGPKYVHERIWAVNSLDPRWRSIDMEGGLCGEDVGLNDFRPQYFLINGRAQPRGLITPTDPIINPRTPITDLDVAVKAAVGEPILLRVIAGNYFPFEIQFGDATRPVTAEVWSSDARPFRTSTDYNGSTSGRPAPLFLNRRVMSASERYDFLLNTERFPLTANTSYPVTITHRHWLSGGGIGVRNVGVTQTQITIV